MRSRILPRLTAESERERLLDVAAKARKEVVKEKYSPLLKCQGEDSLKDHILRDATQDMQRGHYPNQKTTLELNLRHPLIKELPRKVEDKPADKSASDMTVMTYSTATNRSGYSLIDTVNFTHQIEAMMRQTLGVDTDEMIDEKEEPPEEHDDQDQDNLFKDVTEVPAPRQNAMEEQNLVEYHKTREEGEIAPLDTLYPTMRVSPDGEKQQTHHRMSAMHESTYQDTW
jgi:hypothetical protein